MDRVKNERDNNLVRESLKNIENAARDNSNLMPHILLASKHYVTLGEMADVMRKVFGEYKS